MPPMSWTSKWRWPMVRLAASRTTAKTGGRISSIASFALFAILDRADIRLPFGDLRAQFVVAKRGDLRLEPVDLVDVGPEPLDFAVVLRAEDFSRNEGKS